MTSNKSDRVLTLYDEQDRAIRLDERYLDLPVPLISDAPYRCLRINEQWFPIVSGALSLLLEIGLWRDAQDERYSGIQQILQLLEGSDCVDCAELEPCLETSTTITTIQGDITNNTTNITNNTTNITNNSSAITNNSSAIQELEQTSASNEFPDPPTIYDPNQDDNACGSAWYVAEQLRDFIVNTHTDAQTLTLPEFLANILNTFGWAIQPLIDLFSQFLAGMSGTFITDVQAVTSELAEYIYCADLNVSQGVSEFAVNSSASLEVRDAYVDALACILPATISKWIVIGSTDTTRDCSGFVCNNISWRYTWTGSNLANWGENTGNATFDGTKWIGLSDNGGLSRTVQLFKNNQSFNFYRFEGFFRARASRTSGTDGLDLLYQDENTASVFSPKYNTNNFLFEGYWGFNDSQIIRTVNGNLVLTANVAAAVANDPNCICEITEIVIEGFGVPPALDGNLTYI